ncbi:hypothetical protein BOTBODRAFT_107885, partial [Botryobasidium botryosum FD-172 SS1]
LPQHAGWLPRWQLLVSSLAVFNTVQNLVTLSLTKRVYNGAPHQVTPLQSRTFAVWTFTAAIVRLYCAYHITEKTQVPFNVFIYDITIWSYIIALAHFGSELIFYRTTNLTGPVISPFIVATTSLTWMLSQYTFYVKE